MFYVFLNLIIMKTIIQKIIICLTAFNFSLNSCQKLELVNVTKLCPLSAPTSINYTSAVIMGRFADVGEGVSSFGHCWSTDAIPDIFDSKTVLNGAPPKRIDFKCEIQGLVPNTTYYVRLYAIIDGVPSYSDNIATFKTQGTVTDIDGNSYNVIAIGNQVWMKENLKTTKYKNNIGIQNITDNAAWSGLTTGAYCWYDNNITNKSIYGALYNWYTVNTGNLCPTGWHVPTDAEWTTLTTFLGGKDVAGSKLKEAGTVHWNSPNSYATNESGFTGIPGGFRVEDASFAAIGDNCLLMLNVDNGNMAEYANLAIEHGHAYSMPAYKNEGSSVRCIKD
jgi:uncharacterized protein (TIGR02145 family)